MNVPNTAAPKAPDFTDGELVRQSVEAMFHEVYLVGGAVRDMLLGRQVTDFDFATPELPGTIQHVLEAEGLKIYPAGIRYGTVGTKIGPYYVEITSFRAETYHPDSRNPSVTFGTDITTDLSRRDFTMNAMAYSSKGLIDPFNGEGDIKRRIIRAVGNAEERFIDDPLRILRLFRFVAQLGFEVEADTLEAAASTAQYLEKVSSDRIRGELSALLSGTYWANAVEDLISTRILHAVFPGQQSFAFLEADAFQDQLLRYSHSELQIMDELTKWALLLRASFEAVQSEWGATPAVGPFSGIAEVLNWSAKTNAKVRQLLR